MHHALQVKACLAGILFVGSLAVLPGSANAQGFSAASILGDYVMAFDGTFASLPPPPFPQDPLDFEAAEVGRFSLDGAGRVYGDYTLTFHNVEIPFPVRSRFHVTGTYTVEPDGHLVIETEEYHLDASGTPGAEPANEVTYECYLVHRMQSAKCVQHTLITYQQGPQPKLLPDTMSGSLERQQ
jgi:hypothetical protein